MWRRQKHRAVRSQEQQAAAAAAAGAAAAAAGAAGAGAGAAAAAAAKAEDLHQGETKVEEAVDSLMIRADAMVTALVMGKSGVQKEMVRMLRLMSKLDDEHRLAIADAGAIPHLLTLLCSTDSEVQDDAISCLLNLSIAEPNKERIMATKGALDKIVGTLRTGIKAESRQNASAAVLSLAIVESYRDTIGQCPLLIPGLVDLFLEGSIASARDAIKSLFHLSLCSSNKPRMVNAGAVSLLLDLQRNRPDSTSFTSSNGSSSSRQEQQQVANNALALLTQLCACPEGVTALLTDSGTGEDGLALLMELLSCSSSSRSREHAAAALLMLCQTGGDKVVDRLLEFEHCVSALCDLLSAGSQRAKSKAGALMQLLMVNDRS